MKVSRLRLAKFIDDQTTSTADTQALAKEIAAYLLSEGRTGELDSIIRDVMQLRADRGLVEVIAVDAFPLTEQVYTEIRELIHVLFPDTKNVIISELRDKAVVGGTKLILANLQLDVSVRSKLNRFKRLTVVTGGAQA
jgi:F0F1-type ATP synthase delta subunit